MEEKNAHWRFPKTAFLFGLALIVWSVVAVKLYESGSKEWIKWKRTLLIQELGAISGGYSDVCPRCSEAIAASSLIQDLTTASRQSQGVEAPLRRKRR